MNLETIDRAYNSLKVLNAFEDKDPIIASLLQEFNYENDDLDIGDAYRIMIQLEDCELTVVNGILFRKWVSSNQDMYWNGGMWCVLNDWKGTVD